MIIRDAVPADIPALARLYAAAEGAVRVQLGAAPLAPVPGLEAWFERRMARPEPPVGRFLVAQLDGDAELAGLVETGPPAELRAIYVHPASWGTAVAGALHDRALEHLRACGQTTARLSVIARNARARRFYERRGWILAGEDVTREVGGVAMAFVSYARDLSA